MKSFKHYSAYHDSSVEWLGKIPKHWGTIRVKHLSWFKYGASLNCDARKDGEIPVYGSNGKVGTHSESNTHAPCIIVGRKGSYGKVNYSSEKCFAIDTTFYIDDTSTKCDIRWLYYCLSIVGLDSYSQDSAVPGLSRDFAHNLWLPRIPDNEQRTIADFLDRETSRIDALIYKYQRLIELLEEKHTSLINKVITKGFHSSGEFKASSLPWVQDIPYSWSVVKNGYLFTERDERGCPDLPLLNVSIHTGVSQREFSTEHIEQMASDWSTYKVARKGDIAYNKMRMWQGAVGIVPIDGLVSPDYTVACPRENVNSRYFEYLFRIDSYKNEINRFSHGIVPDRNRLYWEQFKQMPSLFPPFEEQNELVDYLDNETKKKNQRIEKNNQMVKKLQEYRSALISSAVTGKIDIRN